MKKEEDIDFLFKVLPKFSNRMVKSYFNLPLDNYLGEGQIFRERGFSKVLFSGTKPNVVGETNFFQDEEINRYAGGIDRKYDLVEPTVCQDFIDLYRNYIGPVFYNPNCEVGFHQIRVLCDDSFVGHPVPEGWHTDGFDFVAMTCVAASNFTGGTSRIRSNLGSDHDFFSKILQPSEMLIFNDRRYFHHTDPITNQVAGKIGYRDILVITILML